MTEPITDRLIASIDSLVSVLRQTNSALQRFARTDFGKPGGLPLGPVVGAKGGPEKVAVDRTPEGHQDYARRTEGKLPPPPPAGAGWFRWDGTKWVPAPDPDDPRPVIVPLTERKGVVREPTKCCGCGRITMLPDDRGYCSLYACQRKSAAFKAMEDTR